MISTDLLKIRSALTEAHLTKGLKRPLFKFPYKHKEIYVYKHSQTTPGLLINNNECRFYKQQHEAQRHEEKQSITLVQPRAKELIQLFSLQGGVCRKKKKKKKSSNPRHNCSCHRQFPAFPIAASAIQHIQGTIWVS